jgi:PKD repeat protein
MNNNLSKYRLWFVRVFYVLISGILSFNCFAQKEANIWYFSQSGLDFNYKPARILTNSKINGFEGTASIADTLGNLLFYTDGDTVWNRFHEKMQGGIGIGGSGSNSCPSAPLIVRLPNSYRYYYVFTATQRNPPGLEADEVRYSIIDIEQNSGKGRVISQRNVLVKNSAEKIAAVLHGNKRDVWVAVKQNGTDTLFVFKLTPNGLSSTIIKNKTYRDSIYNTGQMKFSPNGKYLAFGNIGVPDINLRSVYLYNFDSYSGTLNDERKIMVGSYGIEFSPNSRYLYLSNIYQIPISKISKVYYLDSTMYIGKNPGSYPMQLAPDGKLYIRTNDSFLHVVEYPNLEGKNCGFKYKEQAIYIKKTPFSHISIPVFLASYFQTEAFNIVKTCIGKPVNFILSEAYKIDSVYWDFGDTASHGNNTSKKITNITHIYKQYGNYTVKLVTFYDNRSDTTTAVVSFKNPKPDFTALDVCDKDSIKFNNKSSVSVGQLNYKWKFGDGQNSNLESPSHLFSIGGVSQTYNVTLVATMIDGCSDSIIKPVTVNANPVSDFSFTINKNSVDFKASQSGNTSYKWNFGNGDSAIGKDIIYTYPKSGKYTACLIVTNAAGCFTKTCNDVSVTVGVSSISKSSGITIYPNPNTGNFTIEIENPSKDISIEIFNLLGKLMKTVETRSSKSVYEIDLNTADGMYWVRIKNGESVWNQNVVISYRLETYR